MNDEYLVAYSLYQMLYTDDSEWSTNFSFFDDILKDILPSYGKCEYEYYYEFAKKVILSTNISHRINTSFLDTLWSTKEQTISNLGTWYCNFGQRHRSTPFRLFYIQSLFTSKSEQRYVSMINLNKNEMLQSHNVANSICKEYLQLLTYKPRIQKEERLNATISALFSIKDFEFNKLLVDLELKSILYFEYMLKYDFSFSKQLSYHDIFIKYIEIVFEDRKSYYFRSTEMMHFFVLKMIDHSYKIFL